MNDFTRRLQSSFEPTRQAVHNGKSMNLKMTSLKGGLELALRRITPEELHELIPELLATVKVGSAARDHTGSKTVGYFATEGTFYRWFSENPEKEYEFFEQVQSYLGERFYIEPSTCCEYTLWPK